MKKISLIVLWFLLVVSVVPQLSQAYTRNESINRKIDVYNNYFRKGKNFADVVTFLNANLDKKYELLIAQETLTLTANATIPTNAVTISFERGGVITFGTYDLTFSNQYIDAPINAKIFNYDSTGQVQGKISNTEVYSEWWGAITDDSVDDSAEWQYTVDAFDDVTLQMGNGDYNLSNQGSGYAFQINKESMTLRGGFAIGRNNADYQHRFIYTGTENIAISIGDGLTSRYGIVLTGFALENDNGAASETARDGGRTDVGIDLNQVNQKALIENCYIHGFYKGINFQDLSLVNDIRKCIFFFNEYGIYIVGTSNTVRIENSMFNRNWIGLAVASGSDYTIEKNSFEKNGQHDVLVGGSTRSVKIVGNRMERQTITDNASVVVNGTISASSSNSGFIMQNNYMQGNNKGAYAVQLTQYLSALFINNEYDQWTSGNVYAESGQYYTLQDYHRSGTENVGSGTQFDITDTIAANSTVTDEFQTFRYENFNITQGSSVTKSFTVTDGEEFTSECFISGRWQSTERSNSLKTYYLGSLSSNSLVESKQATSNFSLGDEVSDLGFTVAARGASNIVDFVWENNSPTWNINNTILEFRFRSKTLVAEE